MTNFEWDKEKNQRNIEVHGLDVNTQEKTSKELLAISDEEIQHQIEADDDAAPVLDLDFFENATMLEPEVITWFKERYGKRYQVYMMNVLREHIEKNTL